MDESRRAIRQGRDWAARGAYARARTTWRAAQARAYRAQDHAALFVLSVNVGEACVRLAAQSPDPAAVYEAQANLEYAVQVVHECGLEWHVGRRHSELARGVRRAEMLRREVAKLLDAMRVADDDGPTAAADAKETDSECTTCGQRRGQQRAMVLDASDGCYYCSACYEEYYATVAVDAAGDPGVNEWMADEAMNAQHDHSERDGCSVDARIAEEGGDGVLDTAASLWRPVVEDVVLHEKLDDRVDEQKTGGTTVDRIRYDRVELGSLAEYLTGKCQVGDKDEQLGSSKPSDDVDDTCVPVADASTDDDRHHVEVHRKESFAASDELQEKLREACVATVDDDSLREEETALVDEDTVDKACENRKYSIPRLLDLRRVSPRDCPECLLESPVRDDGSVCKRVHSRAGSSRKTSSSKLTPR
ncbi:unnamed protein product [Hyaloperonospora brassicae]|uniref:ZZ-type domain-containing protein n=1 Tax=Hyaloperonospora brassicae TaxID=162125 RepID=A0AAV0T436_HYABA|nr:unnamed protein product [Hyaloperonospora brassicae]